MAFFLTFLKEKKHTKKLFFTKDPVEIIRRTELLQIRGLLQKRIYFGDFDKDTRNCEYFL